MQSQILIPHNNQKNTFKQNANKMYLSDGVTNTYIT